MFPPDKPPSDLVHKEDPQSKVEAPFANRVAPTKSSLLPKIAKKIIPKKAHPYTDDWDDDGGEETLWGKAFKILFVLSGIAVLAWLFYFGPQQERQRCAIKYGIYDESSVTTFGTCRQP